MLSVEGFVKRCATAIREGKPFLAYRHAHGFGFVYIETAYLAHRIEADFTGVRDIETKRARCPKSIVNGLRKEIKKMQKDPRTCPLYVVDFDGNTLTTEGGGLDELYSVPIPGDGDPVDS